MKHFATLCLAAVAAGRLLLATPTRASTLPVGKRPTARRVHSAPVSAAAAPCCGTAASTKAAVPAPAPAAATQLASATAPQTVQLKGIVLNADGRPCPGASVYPAGAPRQLAVTDAQGAFTLPVPAGGAVSLRVEYFGEGSSRVEVPTPGTELLRITLGK